MMEPMLIGAMNVNDIVKLVGHEVDVVLDRHGGEARARGYLRQVTLQEREPRVEVVIIPIDEATSRRYGYEMKFTNLSGVAIRRAE